MVGLSVTHVPVQTVTAPVKPRVKPRVVVERKPESEPEPELGREPVFGRPFIGPNEMAFFYGEKSVRGDPFWMSKSAPLVGKSQAGAREYCAQLTARERALGKVPSGYGYHPSLAGDGKIALCVEYVWRQDGTVVQAEVIDLPSSSSSSVVTQEYRSHVTGRNELRFGDSFRNGSGLSMEYRKADPYGNPYWLSAETPVAGLSVQRASQYCLDLTESEGAADRLPRGYRYVATKGGGGIVMLGKTR